MNIPEADYAALAAIINETYTDGLDRILAAKVKDDGKVLALGQDGPKQVAIELDSEMIAIKRINGAQKAPEKGPKKGAESFGEYTVDDALFNAAVVSMAALVGIDLPASFGEAPILDLDEEYAEGKGSAFKCKPENISCKGRCISGWKVCREGMTEAQKKQLDGLMKKWKAGDEGAGKTIEKVQAVNAKLQEIKAETGEDVSFDQALAAKKAELATKKAEVEAKKAEVEVKKAEVEVAAKEEEIVKTVKPASKEAIAEPEVDAVPEKATEEAAPPATEEPIAEVPPVTPKKLTAKEKKAAEKLKSGGEDSTPKGKSAPNSPKKKQVDPELFHSTEHRALIDGKLRELLGSAAEAEIEAAEKAMKKVLDRTDVFIRLPSQSLETILKEGFKNFFETGTTGGSSKTINRLYAEEEALGISTEAPAKDRPIYAYLAEATNADEGANGYGDIAVKLKPQVKERSTFTGSDSFGGFPASPVLKPRLSSLFYEMEFPDSEEENKEKIKKVKAMKNHDELNGMMGNFYTEAQIHGGVKPSDISEITFYEGRKASAAVKAWAAKNNVKILEE